LFGISETELVKKEDAIWEAIQLINGDVYIYHKGFKEEASMEDVFKYTAGESIQFTRLDKNSVTPAKDSPIRLNRATIAFAWYVDSESNIVQEIKKTIAEHKG
jgi:hypothetical protein